MKTLVLLAAAGIGVAGFAADSFAQSRDRAPTARDRVPQNLAQPWNGSPLWSDTRYDVRPRSQGSYQQPYREAPGFVEERDDGNCKYGRTVDANGVSRPRVLCRDD
ncbi:MAG TPA: hypothetical protein VIL09_10515 [Microvirga sp.]|jgi:hypothetical protein